VVERCPDKTEADGPIPSTLTMNYFYVLFPFIVWIISQSIKFGIRVYNKNAPKNIKGIFWVYAWAGGTPSTHTAILTSSLVLVLNYYGMSPIFTFALVVTLICLYDMITDRKRQEMMDDYYLKDTSLTNVVSDGYILDLAGHTKKEIFWGGVLGVTIGLVAMYFGF